MRVIVSTCNLILRKLKVPFFISSSSIGIFCIYMLHDQFFKLFLQKLWTCSPKQLGYTLTNTLWFTDLRICKLWPSLTFYIIFTFVWHAIFSSDVVVWMVSNYAHSMFKLLFEHLLFNPPWYSGPHVFIFFSDSKSFFGQFGLISKSFCFLMFSLCI